MSKNYFRYLLRIYRYLIVFFFAVYLSVTLLYALPNGSGTGFYDVAASAGVLSVCACYALPVVLFSFVHHRSSSDVYFALPISRRQQRHTILAFAFAVNYIFFAAAVLLGFVLYGIGHVRLLSLAAVLGYGAFMYLALLVINSALYLLGNNVLDGIVILAAYTLFFFPSFIAESVIVERMVAGANTFLEAPVSMCLSPIVVLASNYAALTSTHFAGGEFRVLYFLLGMLYALIGWLGLRHEFDERQSERAEAISDHILAYPTIINLYAVVMLAVVGSSIVASPGTDAMLAYLALLVCYVAGTFLYQRRIRLDFKRVGVFLLEAAATLVLMYVCWHTQGFGAARAYRMDQGRFLVYEYSASVEQEDFSRHVSGEENTYVRFTLNVPVDKKEQYQEVLQILEGNRGKAIDAFYRNYSDFSCYLRVYNLDDPEGTAKNEYFYRPEVLLTEEELKRIAEQTDVFVSDYGSYDVWQGNQVLLNQYLAWRDGRKQ